jgi:hypothetical protein
MAGSVKDYEKGFKKRSPFPWKSDTILVSLNIRIVFVDEGKGRDCPG